MNSKLLHTESCLVMFSRIKALFLLYCYTSNQDLEKVSNKLESHVKMEKRKKQ
jgi:hypothetical protein